MKRFILVFALLAVSAGAKAEWDWVARNSSGTVYMWYPMAWNSHWSYPYLLDAPARSQYVKGWRYRARSIYTANTVDCRDGAMKMGYGYFYSNANGTGARIRIGSRVLSNGLYVVPGRWYRFSQFPWLARKSIELACSSLGRS